MQKHTICQQHRQAPQPTNPPHTAQRNTPPQQHSPHALTTMCALSAPDSAAGVDTMSGAKQSYPTPKAGFPCHYRRQAVSQTSAACFALVASMCVMDVGAVQGVRKFPTAAG